MSDQADAMAPEGEIRARENTFGSLAIKVLLFASIPSVVILMWLSFWTLPNYAEVAKTKTSEAIAIHQANAMGTLVTGTQERVNQAARTLSASSGSAINVDTRQSIASAASVTVIQLTDLGIASLDPSDYGLKSHILLDLVRRAYNQQSPPPEAVKLNDSWVIAFASPWKNQSGAGVLLAQFPGNILSAMAISTETHQVGLLQTFDDEPAISILNSEIDITAKGASAKVPGTRWVIYVSASAHDENLDFALPLAVWLLLAIGLAAAYWLLTKRLPRQLSDDVSIITETVDTRAPIILNHEELKPLALMLRQLSAISRRRGNPKSSGRSSGQPRDAASTAIPSDATALGATANDDSEVTEMLGWKLSDKGFASRGLDNLGQDNKPLDELASGAANVAHHISLSSFVIGYSGSNDIRKHKTHLLKKLLSNGIDVVDLDETTAPLIHLAVNEGMASGSLYLRADLSGEELEVDITLNGRSASRAQWQNLLTRSHEPRNHAGNGRTMKSDLSAKYTDRISLDVAMEDPMHVVIGCPDQVTLSLAVSSLTALGCNTEAVLTGMSVPAADQLQSVSEKVSSSRANLGVYIDRCGECLHVVSERGELIRNDQILMLFSKDVLDRHPGNEVLYGPSCSRNLPGFVTSCGGSAKMVSTTRHRLQSTMETEGAIVAGDTNGSFIIRDRWFGSSDAVYASCRLVEILSHEGVSLASILDTMPRSFASSALSFDVDDEDLDSLLACMTDSTTFVGAKVTELDGVRIDFADSWAFLSTADRNSDQASFYFEGDSEDALKRIQGVIRETATEVCLT